MKTSLLILLLLTISMANAQIQRRVDQFTDEITINTALTGFGGVLPTIMYKSINGSDTTYYLSLKTHGLTLNTGERGVIVLFRDGSKWHSDENIDVESGYEDWQYSSFIAMTKDDIDQFSSKEIDQFRLYIYDHKMRPGDADRFRKNVKILIDTH